MEIDTIINLISSLGFPIFCCVALFYTQNKTIKEYTNKIDDSIQILSKSINDNKEATVTLITTVEMLSKVRGDN